MPPRITFLAPARTVAQRETRFASPHDSIEPPAEGAESAIAAIRAGLHDDAVMLGGPEHRVAQTARALGLEVAPVDELAAWSSGAWAGRSVVDVAALEPDAFGAWRTDPHAGAPGGESLAAFLTRVAHWLERSAHERRSVVIADSSAIRAVIVRVLAAPPATFWNVDVRPLSQTVIQGDGSRWRLRSLSELVHRDRDADSPPLGR